MEKSYVFLLAMFSMVRNTLINSETNGNRYYLTPLCLPHSIVSTHIAQ